MTAASSRPAPAADPSREKRILEQQVPSLAGAEYRITSESTPRYNCVAWAVGDYGRNWSPAPIGGYYWPEGIDPWPTAEVVKVLFERRGYSECAGAEAEEGVEKVAIFVDGVGEARHVAFQPAGGKWTGKMGDLADIEHGRIDDVESGLCGRLWKILCRATAEEPPPGRSLVRGIRSLLGRQ